jgi:hypothetical protein
VSFCEGGSVDQQRCHPDADDESREPRDPSREPDYLREPSEQSREPDQSREPSEQPREPKAYPVDDPASHAFPPPQVSLFDSMAANSDSCEGFLEPPRSGRSGHGGTRRLRWSSVCSIPRAPAQGRGADAFHRR